MAAKKVQVLNNVRLGKFVHGGQVLANSDDGKALFVWGGLPGELVDVRVTKKRSSYREGIVTVVHEPSTVRVEPPELHSYLSTSPWQIVSQDHEPLAKQAIVTEGFTRAGLEGIEWSDFYDADHYFGYRNKMEFGFWGDDDGIHLAHFVRGSRTRQIVEGSALAMDPINRAAQELVETLNRWAEQTGLRASDLKTVVLRCSADGTTAAALFVKSDSLYIDDQLFGELSAVVGIDIYFSNPQSPASVPTKLLRSYGSTQLTDVIVSKPVSYDVLSFFQVNLPVFAAALQEISDFVTDAAASEREVVDMYSGVGTIGIAVGANKLVESDGTNIEHARTNLAAHDQQTQIVHAPAEQAVEHIQDGQVLIIDPPRAGLHKHVIDRIQKEPPQRIIYLSCNPSTQARDVALLNSQYRIVHARAYNFFPRTPHIESLIVLDLL